MGYRERRPCRVRSLSTRARPTARVGRYTIERHVERTAGAIAHCDCAGSRQSRSPVHRSNDSTEQAAEAFDRAQQGLVAPAGYEYPDFVCFQFVAHFIAVTIDPRTYQVRVPRALSVVDCGKVISSRTARSQMLGGLVWGIGACLREVSEVDPRFGGFLNANLAEYQVPVNADIGDYSVEFIDEPDFTFNPIGAKGLGEVVLAGVAPAIANAIYHATGRRFRSLPIRLDDLHAGLGG